MVVVNHFFMKNDNGLGDTLERILDTIGISGIVKSVKKDCGCKKRKENLNKLFPYKSDRNKFEDKNNRK